jgi:hypothetical protein
MDNEMEPRLAALKLFLDGLEVPATIDTIDDRKRVQKAVYLGQTLSGADLGYRFGWYLMGPYSPALTRDYYALADALASQRGDMKDLRLLEGYRRRLERVRTFLKPPEGIDVPQEDWLELLASLHFLEKVSGMEAEAAARKINEDKANLAPHIPQAQQILRSMPALDS